MLNVASISPVALRWIDLEAGQRRAWWTFSSAHAPCRWPPACSSPGLEMPCVVDPNPNWIRILKIFVDPDPYAE